jgi:8-oxo-dGTP diphosphatase
MDQAMIAALDVFGETHKVNVNDLTWRPSVYGIVIEDDKILLSPQFKGKFDLPGGGVDLGEDLEAAVVREVKEETGIDVEVIRLVGLRNNIFISSHGNGRAYHSILIYYVCKKIGGEISTDGFDEDEQNYAEEAQWVPLSEFDAIELASTVNYKDIVKGVIDGD